LAQISNVAADEDMDSCYNAAISCCPWSWALHLALKMAGSRRHRGMLPGITAGTVLRALHRAGREDLARVWADDLRRSWHKQFSQSSELEPPSSDLLKKFCPQAVLGVGVLAVNKPPDCTSESVLDALQTFLANEGWHGQLTLISRLDHQTSGVLPLALGPEQGPAAQWLQSQYAAAQVSKEYLCLCSGADLNHQKGQRMVIDMPLRQQTSRQMGQPRVIPDLKGKEARTEFEVREIFDDMGQVLKMISAWPLTGRMHQIRAHMASLGHPIVGDRAYGDQSRSMDRTFLHCHAVSLMDLEGKTFVVEYPLPEDLLQILARLRGQEISTPHRVGRWWYC